MNISTNLPSSNQAGVTGAEQSGRPIVQTRPSGESSSLANVAKGTVFQGEIIQVQGNQVRIQVGAQILNALLEQGVQVRGGEHLLFMVKENSANKIMLKPFADTGQNVRHVLTNILEEASLPVTERNINAVKEMMNNGMPVDRNAMGEIGRLLNQFQSANVETIIGLKSHNLPVTEQNIGQFEAYQNAKGKVLNQLQEFTGELHKMIGGVTTQEQAASMKELFGKLNGAFAEIGGEGKASFPDLQGQVNMVVRSGGEMAQLGSVKQAIVSEGTVVAENNAQTARTIGAQIHQTEAVQQSPSTAQTTMEAQAQAQSQAAEMTSVISIEAMKSELKELAGQIEKNIKEKFLLTPEQLSQDGKKAVDELYEKLNKTMEQITRVLEEAGQSSSKLMNTARDLKNNMSFMQDFNQLASYVQLPVKLGGNEQTGELYVMSRKRGKAQAGETLTAFLHLDMEYLGATDVRVALTDGKITTKFTLDNDESMRLVEEHLDELKERLEKLGYSAIVTVDEVEEKKIPFQEILEVDKPKKMVKKYSFDVEI